MSLQSLAGHVTTWSRSSKNTGTSSTWVRHEQKKPSEVFRTDFITAMKLPDSAQLSPEEFYFLSDPWRQEWEKGVQVPANVEPIPEPVVRMLPEVNRIPFFSPIQTRGQSEFGFGESHGLPEPLSSYDLDDLDVTWLELVNTEFRQLELDELTMEQVVVELENRCQQNMQQAIETEEGLGIEYDEIQDSSMSKNCYILPSLIRSLIVLFDVLTGCFLTCVVSMSSKVSIGCPEKMEPITKVSHIPASRWALSCGLCREHTGTCIQCSMPSCIVAFHVTCAFDHGLEMRTTLAENDEVRFKSYCLEHSSISRSSSAEREKASQRKQKLQELEDEFYRLVDPKDVAESLSLPDVHVDFLFQYWKLRRKANFNQPLVARKRDEVDNLAQQEQDVLYRRLKLFTHLRQDLERVRNLCYMVTRREKIKHSLCSLQEKIFTLQIQLLEKDLIHRNGVRERVKERRKSRPDKKDKWRSDDSSVFTQLGFSKSFPLDGSLFDSWLAQSVHITADNMLSQWSLSGESRNPSASLLSDQLLQGEENLLSLMMDHSIKSTWKTPQLGRKPRGAPRSRRKSVSLPRIRSAVKGKVCPEDQPPKRGERVRHAHHHHTRSSEGRLDPLQPAISKMDSCHISEEHGSWVAGADNGDTESNKRSQVALRLRLPRQGKSRSKSNTTQALLQNSTGNNISAHDTETDGYFSDAEQSDSELRSFSRKLRLPQLHAGKEEVVRRSVLAS
uniref:Protein Jade-2-like n=1 Tax=Sinocyclocheilus rhinocerous TaxID=307959 RepID=A0A673N4J3_9TELE